MLWSEDIPRITVVGSDGAAAVITLIAGRPADVDAEIELPTPPPNSWASRPEADLGIWHVALDPGAAWTMPPASGEDTVRTVYVFEGDGVTVAGRAVGGSTGVLVRSDVPIVIEAGAGAVEALVLQGRPIGEPVARYGPFVMNTEQEIEQAFADYRETGFGGWPWPSDAPVHPRGRGRFARHADGRIEEPVP